MYPGPSVPRALHTLTHLGSQIVAVGGVSGSCAPVNVVLLQNLPVMQRRSAQHQLVASELKASDAHRKCGILINQLNNMKASLSLAERRLEQFQVKATIKILSQMYDNPGIMLGNCRLW